MLKGKRSSLFKNRLLLAFEKLLNMRTAERGWLCGQVHPRPVHVPPAVKWSLPTSASWGALSSTAHTTPRSARDGLPEGYTCFLSPGTPTSNKEGRKQRAVCGCLSLSVGLTPSSPTRNILGLSPFPSQSPWYPESHGTDPWMCCLRLWQVPGSLTQSLPLDVLRGTR